MSEVLDLTGKNEIDREHDAPDISEWSTYLAHARQAQYMYSIVILEILVQVSNLIS